MKPFVNYHTHDLLKISLEKKSCFIVNILEPK